MEALDNAWYGSWRPWTNLMQTFRACHLYTFNVAAILFRGHPYIWRSIVRQDIRTKIKVVPIRLYHNLPILRLRRWGYTRPTPLCTDKDRMSAEVLPNGLLYGKLPGNRKVPILDVADAAPPCTSISLVLAKCIRIFLAVVIVLRGSGGKRSSHLRRQCDSYREKRKSESSVTHVSPFMFEAKCGWSPNTLVLTHRGKVLNLGTRHPDVAMDPPQDQSKSCVDVDLCPHLMTYSQVNNLDKQHMVDACRSNQ